MDQKQTSEHDLRLREFIDENGFLYKMLNDEYTKSYKDLVKTLLDEVLPFMPMFSKYYTDHGAYHSKEVVKMMDKLVEKITRPINSDEAFVLLASAWLHDIGMLNNTDPLTGSYLNDKEIRNRHGELSERVIENYKDKIFHHNIVNAKTLITSIKLVCRHHDQAKETFEDINDAAEEDIEEAGQIRKKLLISILRLADLLDLRKNRAPILPGEIFKIPTESSLHWKIYEIVNQYYIKNETEGHNTILEIIIKGEIEKDEEKIFKTSLFYYQIKQIEEEISNVKKHFKGVKILIRDKIRFDLSVGEKKITTLPWVKNYSFFFDSAKKSFDQFEFDKLKGKTKSPFILFDYCLNEAENRTKWNIKKAKNKKEMDFQAEENDTERNFQIEWRAEAQEHSRVIKNKLPPTSYYMARIKYNDLYLEKLKKGDFKYVEEIEKILIQKNFKEASLEGINLEDKFLYGMFPKYRRQENYELKEKINILESLNYLKKSINVDVSEYLFGVKLTLFKYGFTAIDQKILQTVFDIINNHIVVDPNSKFASLHNECCLCTGTALSILSYFLGMDMEEILTVTSYNRVSIQNSITNIFNWVSEQKINRFSKLNGKSRFENFFAICFVMKGLLDLYFFNQITSITRLSNKEIKYVIDQVKSVLLEELNYDEMNKNQKNLLYPILSNYYLYLIIGGYYFRLFKDNSFFENIKHNKWVNEIFERQDRCFLERLVNYSSPILLIKLIDGSEKEKLEKIASGFIDELILKNDEWRSNGSFNNNLYFTNAALRMWFGYWEHHWRREEENNQQEDKKCNIMMIG